MNGNPNRSADDESAILAAYHELVVDDSEQATKLVSKVDSTSLRGELHCLQMMERSRRLSLESTKQSGDLDTSEATVSKAQKVLDGLITDDAKDENDVRIGRFRIVRKLGQGGYGVVLLAIDPELDREVALKVPKLDSLLDSEFVCRFEREAKIAGGLRHPHIVPVYESGSIGPVSYIASAYCKGPTLAQWLDDEPITNRSAARLLVTLAQAIQYAHSMGVLHRDIKPSNILLERVSEGPVSEDELHEAARLCDFGLAKRVDDNNTMTNSTAILGTPAYMSPEQAESKVEEISTRSDIFSLGCVLHELLTGDAPFRRDSRLATLQALRTEEASSKGMAQIPRDLQAITLKCLEKRPTNRYQTADALTNDLQAYLAGRPVSARTITPVQKLGRWAHRNPMLAGLLGLVTALTLLIAIGSTATAIQLSRSQQRIEQEARNKATVSQFLSTEILGQANPLLNSNRNLTLVEALEQASQKLEGHFREQPLVEAELRLTLGRVAGQLAKFEQAESHLSRAHELTLRELGADDPKTLKATYELGYLHYLRDKWKEALQIWSETVVSQRRQLGGDHPDTLLTQNYMAYCHTLLKQFDEAETLFAQTVPIYVRRFGEKHPDTLDCLDNKARMLRFQRKSDEAEELIRRVLRLRREVLGESHPHYFDTLQSLASLRYEQRDWDEAAELYQKLFESRRELLGDDHPDVLTDGYRAATATRRAGDYDASEQLYLATIAGRRMRYGPNNHRTVVAMQGLGDLHEYRDDYDRAIAVREKVIQLLVDEPGEDSFDMANALGVMARTLETIGRWEQARQVRVRELEVRRLPGIQPYPPLYAEALYGHVLYQLKRNDEGLDIMRSNVELWGPETPQRYRRFFAYRVLGMLQARVGRFDDAEAVFLESYEKLQAADDLSEPYRAACERRLVKQIVSLYEAAMKTNEANHWRSILEALPES